LLFFADTQQEAVAVAAGPDFGPRAAPVPRHSEEPRPRDRLKQRNQTLAVLLAGIAALVLVVAVTVAVLLHYVELHHLLSNR
jgi:hypothetical protein